jgi:hypothetical protein
VLIEGAVLRVGTASIRVRIAGEEKPLTIRAALREDLVPGEIASVELGKRWRYAGHEYAAGRLVGVRLDVASLGLVPLPVHEHGRWSPEAGGDDPMFGVSPEVRRILPREPLPDCEMEQVIPGADLDDPWGETDPAIMSSDLANMGDIQGGWQVLERAVAQDLRYLDGHAHMGNLRLRGQRSEWALAMAARHYAVGVAIGRSFLPPGFAGYLRGINIHNRPFLRCLHGLALAQGAGGDHAAAEATLRELLRFDPQDRSGAQILLHELAAGDTSRWAFDEEDRV